MWEVELLGWVEQNVGSWTIGVKKCGKWDLHFNVELAIFGEITCVSHIKWFC